MDSSHFRPLHEPSAYLKETELIDKGENNDLKKSRTTTNLRSDEKCAKQFRFQLFRRKEYLLFKLYFLLIIIILIFALFIIINNIEFLNLLKPEYLIYLQYLIFILIVCQTLLLKQL